MKTSRDDDRQDYRKNCVFDDSTPHLFPNRLRKGASMA